MSSDRSRVQYSWNQPCCERCWIDGLGLDNDGHLRIPVRTKEPIGEVCAFCGILTIFGVYVRRNPEEVRFPAIERTDDETEGPVV